MMSTQPWEPRVSRLEAAYEQVDRRLGSIETSVESLRQHIDARFASGDAQFRWMICMIFTGWLTTILALFFHR